MPDIKLWYSSGACSLAPHVLLREIGVPFDGIETSVAKAAHLTEEFGRINPKKRVPVLSLDGEVITEVPAIATAIADLAPERHLMGRTALDRARVYEWMNWLSGTLHGQGFGALWRPQRFSDEPDVFDSIKEGAENDRRVLRRYRKQAFGSLSGRRRPHGGRSVPLGLLPLGKRHRHADNLPKLYRLCAKTRSTGLGCSRARRGRAERSSACRPGAADGRRHA